MKDDVSVNWIIIVRAVRSVQRVGLCWATCSDVRQLPLGTSTKRTATPSPLASRTGCAGTQKPIDWLLSSPASRTRTLSRSRTSRARPPRHQPGRPEVHTIRWTDGRPGCVNRGSVGALRPHHVHRELEPHEKFSPARRPELGLCRLGVRSNACCGHDPGQHCGACACSCHCGGPDC